MRNIGYLWRYLWSSIQRTSGKREYKNGWVTGDILNNLINTKILTNHYKNEAIQLSLQSTSLENRIAYRERAIRISLQEVFAIWATWDAKQCEPTRILQDIFSYYWIVDLRKEMPNTRVASCIEVEWANDTHERETYEHMDALPEGLLLQTQQEIRDLVDNLQSHAITELVCSSLFIASLRKKEYGIRLLEEIHSAWISIVFVDNYRPKRWKSHKEARDYFLSATAFAKTTAASMWDLNAYKFTHQDDISTTYYTNNHNDSANLLLTNWIQDAYFYHWNKDNVLKYTPKDDPQIATLRWNNKKNTVGMGDATISAFLFYYRLWVPPLKALALTDQTAQIVLNIPRDNLWTHNWAWIDHLKWLPSIY